MATVRQLHQKITWRTQLARVIILVYRDASRAPNDMRNKRTAY